MLGLPGENELVGEGISFCAVCDGDFYTGKTVCVAGGGNSALQEAILLSGKCEKVIMLQDLPEFTGEKKLQEILFARPNVEKHAGVKITALNTEEGILRSVSVQPQAGGEEKKIACDGLFVAIGLIPENDAFAHLAELNKWGYFDSGEGCETKTPGVFAAGDAASGARTVVEAVANSKRVAEAMHEYMQSLPLPRTTDYPDAPVVSFAEASAQAEQEL
jgi:thioredoxin reductase (NADPH)